MATEPSSISLEGVFILLDRVNIGVVVELAGRGPAGVREVKDDGWIPVRFSVQ